MENLQLIEIGGQTVPKTLVEAITDTHGTTLIELLKRQSYKTLRVAASDSSEKDKAMSDLVCDGDNDMTVINSALAQAGDYGTVILSDGTYYVKEFTQLGSSISSEKTKYGAVCITNTSEDQDVVLCGEKDTHGYHNGAIFVLGKTVYDSLSSSNYYSIFTHSGSASTAKHITYANIEVQIYDNEKNICVFDGSRSGYVRMTNCKGRVTSQVGSWNSTPPSTIHLPSLNCVFFKGVSKSMNSQMVIRDCSAYSFGIGFAYQGEHMVAISNCAIWCRYGCAFNYFDSLTTGSVAYAHPMYIFNQTEEMCFNYPYFGDNSNMQSVRIINYHTEHKPEWFALEGKYAEEKIAGSWRGYLNYTDQDFTSGIDNSVSLKFWADGYGAGMRSFNDCHKLLGTTAERETYSPNYGQQYFDTDLNKMVICVDPANKTWKDMSGNAI